MNAVAAMGGAPSSLQEQMKVAWLGLREDLLLHKGPDDPDGGESWVVEDPLRGTTFRLGFAEAALFRSMAEATDLDSAARLFYRNTSLRPDVQQIVSFAVMLQEQHLAKLPAEAAIEKEQDRPKKASDSFFGRVLHGYIYFRIPLLQPDAFLTSVYPWVGWLWSPVMRLMYLVMGIAGLLLTLPQLELYFSTASYLFTPEGAFAFSVSLVLLKLGHEFSHGFTAKGLGLHVRTMGIAFLVMWPILYTDASDSWRLEDRKKRLAIDVAGMMFELVVAGIALFFWAILPDGILRSLMFFLSGASLLSSLLVNFNPFMRFDGYYGLMDIWGIDNLQPRSLELYRHKIRKILWDWKGPPPEKPKEARKMILYAAGVSVYRIMLALTIVFAVYHLFFKALGVLLMAVELWVFAGRPFYMEIAHVIKYRQLLGHPMRILLTLSVFGALIALLSWPLPQVERLPGLVLYDRAAKVLATASGRVEIAPPEKGTHVHEGDVLARLENPSQEHELEQVQRELEQMKERLNVVSTGGSAGGYRRWLLAEQSRLQAELATLRQAVELQSITAPSDGEIVWRNEKIYPGASVAKDSQLASIAQSQKREVWVYVSERVLDRVEDYLDAPLEVHFQDLETEKLIGYLRERGRYPVQDVANNALYDINGGPVVSLQEGDKIRPRVAHFALVLDLPNAPDYLRHGTPVSVWVQGESRSIFAGFIDFVGRALAEEGFL